MHVQVDVRQAVVDAFAAAGGGGSEHGTARRGTGTIWHTCLPCCA
jgi:hypothetical protein